MTTTSKVVAGIRMASNISIGTSGWVTRINNGMHYFHDQKVSFHTEAIIKPFQGLLLLNLGGVILAIQSVTHFLGLREM